jgi:hypothetical protein
MTNHASLPRGPGAALLAASFALFIIFTRAPALPAALGIHPMLMTAKLATLAGLGAAMLANAHAARRFPGFAAEMQRVLYTVTAGVTFCFAGVVALGGAALDGRGADVSFLADFVLPALVCTTFGLVAARMLLGRRPEAAPLATN